MLENGALVNKYGESLKYCDVWYFLVLVTIQHSSFNLHFATFKLFSFFLVGDVREKKTDDLKTFSKKGREWRGGQAQTRNSNNFNFGYFYRVCQDI